LPGGVDGVKPGAAVGQLAELREAKKRIVRMASGRH
jgi:hypothetical protein